MKKLTKDIFIGLPLTSKLKSDNDYFHTITYKTKKGFVKNSAMILQLKIFDRKRLMGKIAMLSKEQFEAVLDKAKKLLIPLQM